MSVQKLLVGMCFLFIGCATSSIQLDTTVAQDDLTLTEAKLRKSLLSDVVYELNLNLDNKSDSFSGTLKAGFNLHNNSHDLRLDFSKGQVKSLLINKIPVEKFKYDQSAIWLPKAQLVAGLNIVEVKYERKYDNNGNGLHKFKDIEDGETYLFTQFEPFSARKMFPCFDQPDLRSTLTLKVLAPKHWQVTSTTLETKKKLRGEHREWEFATTPKIATYLYSLTAGPFKVWHESGEGIPMRLLARKSFSKYVKPSWWFKVSKQGLRYFNNYFNYPYPFYKYDQVIIPELSSSAMENVGNVTFNEKLIPRNRPTREDESRTANVILHEMAHMWFGDIVTMKWWNDLWLNESFATYMAALASFEATEYKESWQNFYNKDKSWAYWEDQLVTTHPIEAKIESIEQAKSNFDGITYGKGAAVIKQLAYYVGLENFRKGVQGYISKHAYSNTELADFILSLQETVKEKDLKNWSKLWLQEAGLDTLRVSLSCSSNKIESVQMELVSATKSLRPHKLQVALFEMKNEKLVLSHLAPIEITRSEMEIPEFKGKNCPDMVIPNYNDHGYVKVILDNRTVNNFKTKLSYIDDVLVRSMAWNNLWQMVLDQRLKLSEFVGIYKSQIGHEKDLKILDRVAGFMVGADFSQRANILYYMPEGTDKNELISYLENLYWSNVKKSKPGSDEFIMWLQKFTRAASTPSGLQIAASSLSDENIFSGHQISQDQRWQILVKLCRYSYPNVQKLLLKESIADKSERGIRWGLACSSSLPVESVKVDWMNRLVQNSKGMPMSQQRVVMNSLFPPEQNKFKNKFKSEYFTTVLNKEEKHDSFFVEEFTSALAPISCNEESVKELAEFLEKNQNLYYPVKRELLISHQEDSRCSKIRSFSQSL